MNITIEIPEKGIPNRNSNTESYQYEVDTYPYGKDTDEGNITVPVDVPFDVYVPIARAKLILEDCEIECEMHMVRKKTFVV